MKKTGTVKSNTVKRAPSSFTYDEYRRFFYPKTGDDMPPEDAEALGRRIAEGAGKMIRAQLKVK